MKYRGWFVRFRTDGDGKLRYALRGPSQDKWSEPVGSYTTKLGAVAAAEMRIDRMLAESDR